MNTPITFSEKIEAGYPQLLMIFIVTTIFAVAMTGCDLGDNGVDFTGSSETYQLHSTEASNVSGAAIFEEITDGSTRITLELSGTDSGAEHPAHIHANAAVEGGGIDVNLSPVDGTTGSSEIVVSSLEDGTPVTYQDLIAYDGHIMVHLSSDDLATVIARGDIGGNAFTGESVTYDLNEADESGVNGGVRFEERNNANTLATIEVTGTPDDGNHPAHIHHNSVAEGGGIAIPFTNVDGATGISRTNIRAGQDGNPTYTELLEFDGHVNVHRSEVDFTVIAEGDIGANYGQEPDNGNGNGNGNGNDDDDDDY